MGLQRLRDGEAGVRSCLSHDFLPKLRLNRVLAYLPRRATSSGSAASGVRVGGLAACARMGRPVDFPKFVNRNQGVDLGGGN